jgi:hypothetical protein
MKVGERILFFYSTSQIEKPSRGIASWLRYLQIAVAGVQYLKHYINTVPTLYQRYLFYTISIPILYPFYT